MVPNLQPGKIGMWQNPRALRTAREGDAPCDIILRLHYHQTQVAILRASRQKEHLEYEGHRFQIYTDLATATLLKQKTFIPLTKALQQHQIRYRWPFPVKLAFAYNGTQHQLSSLQTGMETLICLGLPEKCLEAPTCSSQSSQSSIRRQVAPIWEKVGRSPRLAPTTWLVYQGYVSHFYTRVEAPTGWFTLTAWIMSKLSVRGLPFFGRSPPPLHKDPLT